MLFASWIIWHTPCNYSDYLHSRKYTSVFTNLQFYDCNQHWIFSISLLIYVVILGENKNQALMSFSKKYILQFVRKITVIHNFYPIESGNRLLVWIVYCHWSYIYFQRTVPLQKNVILLLHSIIKSLEKRSIFKYQILNNWDIRDSK